MAEYPVFIVGSARSGTSILVTALHGAGYSGYNEGNFLSLLRIIERSIDRHFAVFGSNHPRELTSHVDVKRLKADLFGVLAKVVSDQFDGRPWFDKTGHVEMIEAIPVLAKYGPMVVSYLQRGGELRMSSHGFANFPSTLSNIIVRI